jgi:hypothetical protein
VIGRPYNDPSFEEEVDRVDEEEPEPEGETVSFGPEGIDDPDTEWVIDEDEAAATLPGLSEDEIWVLVPGEDVGVVTSLPKPRHLPVAIAIRPGEIAVCTGRRREWSRTPVGSSSDDEGLPVAQRVLVVFIRHRASGVKTRPRKYVIVTGQDDELLGWLDYSDFWNFEGRHLKGMIEAAGLEYVVERYTTEVQFESAHPEWVR